MVSLKNRAANCSQRSASSVSSTDTEEYSSNAHNIDHTIYQNCKRSQLKIIFMHKNDLRKWRNSNSNSSNNDNDTYDNNNVKNNFSYTRNSLRRTISNTSKSNKLFSQNNKINFKSFIKYVIMDLVTFSFHYWIYQGTLRVVSLSFVRILSSFAYYEWNDFQLAKKMWNLYLLIFKKKINLNGSNIVNGTSYNFWKYECITSE